MADELQVYLDHLIPRMNLRYKRSSEEFVARGRGSQPENLPMSDLDFGEFKADLLRKPDFQRATNAWAPQDCVSLLESVVNRQVIPSVIMWYSADNGHEYVLDGGHRVSVVMAWIRDDWGDKLPSEVKEMMDDERLQEIKKAAQEVRDLVRANPRVGSIDQYKLAHDDFERILRAKGSPGQEMSEQDFKRALFYNDFRRRAIKFYVQWVEGNYEIAERSFIKINKSGRQLSTWEIKLIENRNSSFARAVMSITSPDSLTYYWPAKTNGHTEDPETTRKIQYITNGLKTINYALFQPPYQSQNVLRQPLITFFGQDADKKPYWIAELLTVLERKQGNPVETERLLAKDNTATPEDLITNGYALVENALKSLEHLAGRTPHSLGVVPSVYFYTRSVRYVRSLLYGFLYWLLAGNEQDILTRKRLFSGHRATFEKILLLYRDDFSSELGRKSGSGSEVTTQTAAYYQEILRLLIKHNDNIESPAFLDDYNNFLSRKLGEDKKQTVEATKKSRLFTQKQKVSKLMDLLISSAPRCEICGGIFDPSEPSGYLQHDHRLEVFRGGKTEPNNQRIVHNFCNNQANREAIEGIRGGQKTPSLPVFYENTEVGGIQQLRLFDDDWFKGQ